ncbi:hypothetical protein BDU57DRAFT_113107 [Ampelomyces quisqualis]|uniref:Uncharacterized protein n=1 Tax=Ampelomyces quisqualis TaxID=50730 RepID=A0A6A5Q6S5_AMPQU|nr:hypothetical protein BDU57DRAFT_113107 [Ampelomyces quisqualis]
MGRRRGKFSFPLPGRRPQKKTDADADDDAASTLSHPSVHEWPACLEDPSSKAREVLGTFEPMFRTTSGQSGYMSMTVSEVSYGSHHDDSASHADPNGYLALPAMSRRASSNTLGHAYRGDERPGSGHSTASYRLRPHTSSSTMRSHYDAKSSPLSISQQTSDSAVRDRALRRGKPQIIPDNSNAYAATQEDATRKAQRKSKPARLDLSKLFPKPRAGEAPAYANPLLSPTKMVNSPTAMSFTSDSQFPKPMTREPTPNPAEPKKLQRKQASAPPPPGSPVRKFERDAYDNAKIHVRRPPKGVQHWFDALDEEDSDEAVGSPMPIHAPKAVRPHDSTIQPTQESSCDRLAPHTVAHGDKRMQRLSPTSRNDNFAHEDLVDAMRVTSPSQYSLHSTRTKESSLSRNNLQDASVLSFSSSEDDDEDAGPTIHRVPVRKSLDIHDDAGEVIIGKAHAYDVRPPRRPSVAQCSMRSSTSTATIQVMYTPELPLPPFHYSRTGSYSGSKRSSHSRQPSVIHEGEDPRPLTAGNEPLSPPAHSVRSARTSASEPMSKPNGKHKYMEVTAEEEALLELMRTKRAAMEQRLQQQTDVEAPHKPYRTSGFLVETSPVRVVEHKRTRRASGVAPSPLRAVPRGRPLEAHYDTDTGVRGSSASDASPASRATLPPHLPTPGALSPLDPFPPSSPGPTASVTSPTTTEHASPLASPVTPGPRAYEEELNVKVASSDTSNENEEVTVLDTGVIDALPNRTKPSASSQDTSSHPCRRTASSGADESIPFSPSHGLSDLTPVSQVSSRPASIFEPSITKLSAKSSRRVSGLALLSNGNTRNREGSVHSNYSSHSQSSSYVNGAERRLSSSRLVTRRSSWGSTSVRSVAASTKSKRTSVSDDVLAAWHSLGGTY